MEYMRGGELLDRLHKLKFFSEREASAIMQVVTSTICYLHKNGVSCNLLVVLARVEIDLFSITKYI